jgi:hypothetical protein
MLFNRVVAFAVLALGFVWPSSAQVVINELCADNGALASPAGTLPDYIEVYNSTTSSVALAGWTLTDDLTKPAKWAFPSGTTIGGKAHLVVWLDDAGAYPGLIATNFSLRSSGEEVALFQGSNQRDYIRFGPQIKDRTICRYPSGGTNWTLGLQTPGTTNISVALGTPLALRINELMATNSLGDDWLELYNPATNLPVAIGNMVLSDTNNLTGLPALWPNGFIDSDGFVQFDCTGDTNRGDHLEFKLSSSTGEKVYLYASNRTTLLDSITFGPQQPDISYGRLPDGGTNFFLFSPAGRATPGAANDWLSLTNIIVNEVMAHTNTALEQAVELVNVTGQPVDISNWWLSNSRNLPLKFRVPAGTVIPAYGFKVFYERIGVTNAGFNHSGTGVSPDFSFNWAHGDDMVLTVGTTTNAVTGQRSARNLPVAAAGIATARYIKSDGGTDFVPESRRSFGHDSPTNVADFRLGTGLSNTYPLVGPVIVSEIMYQPPDVVAGGVTNDNTLDEYIELRNTTNAVIRLYDPAYPTNTWHLEGGVSFRFPTNSTIPATGTVLLVSFNPKTNLTQLAAFRSKYGVPTNVPFFGPYAGKLNNNLDTIELYKPDTVLLPPRPDAGFVPDILIEKIKYQDGAPWPAGSGNTGLSLQRLSHTGYANDQTNWFAGPPTPGSPTIPVMPPIITAQPQDVVALPSGVATFSVTALGTPVLTYQWYWEGLQLPGATSNTYTISGAQSFYAGRYQVIVSNGAGTATSAVATLTILIPPAITGQPVSQVVKQGDNTVLNLTASGTEPLSYRWYFGTNAIAGATGPELVIPNTQTTNVGEYHVVVTNVAGVTSSVTVTVTLGVPPAFIIQPASQFVPVGTNITLIVGATGTGPLAIQWRRYGAAISGATTPLFTLNGVQTNQTGLYDAVVTNSFGARTSVVAVVSIAGPPRLSSVTRLTNGFTQIALDGVNGHIYELAGSTNFSTWALIARLTNTAPRQLFLDTSATNQPRRFYRGKLVQ